MSSASACAMDTQHIPDASELLHDFGQALDDFTLLALDDKQYVQTERLKSWWQDSPVSETTSFPPSRRIDIVLDHVYSGHDKPAYPISADAICSRHNSCIIVFSILLKAKGMLAAKYISEYDKRQILDNQLPYPLSTLEGKNLPFAQEFYEAQLQLSPIKLDLHCHRHYDHPGIVFPYCRFREVGKGGTATLWEVAIQEHFVKAGSEMDLRHCKYEDERFGKCYRFALKRYHQKNEQIFLDEKAAFEALRKNKGMIQYFGDYVEVGDILPDHGGSGVRQTSTHNIILEFAELDLDAYFDETLSPVLEGELSHFWEDMLDVAKALHALHDFTVFRGGNHVQYYGWHADIKPGNILIVQEKFKLADPGFSKFEIKSAKDVTTIKGGTLTYGAPEVFQAALRSDKSKYQFHRSIDIWSLGCVFSIAATWIVLGYGGIQQFRTFRMSAFEAATRSQNTRSTASQDEIRTGRGDYFHDGNDVLPDIREWHDFLRRSLRSNDKITSQILDLVDQSMLRRRPEERTNAEDLCKQLDTILKNYSHLSQPPPPASIMKALLAVDDEASRQPVSSRGWADSNQPREQKGNHEQVQPPKKTTHRSEYLRSELYGKEASSYPESHSSNIPIGYNSLRANPKTHRPRTPSQHHVDAGIHSHMSPPQSPLRESRIMATYGRQSMISSIPSVRSRPKTHNVFQARDELMEGRRSFWGRRKKDKLLKTYFDSRDIIILADNAGTMEDYWAETMNLAEILVMKLEGLNKNGVDLFFTSKHKGLTNCTSASDLKNRMRQALPQRDFFTNPVESLSDIFRGYLKKLRTPSTRLDEVKKMTLIMLTDGKWEGIKDGRQEEQVAAVIEVFMGELKATMAERKETSLDDLERRRVSIEFVQLGDDARAYSTLRFLDDALPNRGIEDIVDHEHARGDVNKMILGSFNEKWDSLDISDNPVMFTDPEHQSEAPASVLRSDTSPTLRSP